MATPWLDERVRLAVEVVLIHDVDVRDAAEALGITRDRIHAAIRHEGFTLKQFRECERQ
jgi:hypothetical protein